MLLSVPLARGQGHARAAGNIRGEARARPPAPILSPKCFPFTDFHRRVDVSSVPSGTDSLNQCLCNHAHIMYFNKVVAKNYAKNQNLNYCLWCELF